MPELVTCPSCGFKTQMVESLLGQRVRCPNCRQRFVAAAAPEPKSGPERSSIPPVPPRPRMADEDFASDERLPFCPGCGRHVRWDVLSCPHCGEELEEESHLARAFRWGTHELNPLPLRRDCLPHRGKLIARMGNLCLIFGGLSLCLIGLGVIICLPLGIVTWALANHDLRQMRSGVMDPRGQTDTETGRIGAIVGLVISLIFGVFYLVIYSGMF
jgi:hypothetical protein